MTFKNYIELSRGYFEDKDPNFHLLCLVSDTAKLLEKVKYYHNDYSLIISDMGDVFFRLFALLEKFGFKLDGEPFNVEDMKVKIVSLNDTYSINEESLVQNYVFEVGVMTNIVTDNMKHGIEVISSGDMDRIKMSLYSYTLMLMILVSKFQLDVDKILELNLDRIRLKNKGMKIRL